MGLRQRCQLVYQATQKLGIKSVRALARATHLSKSSVHRLKQRIEGRQQAPESEFWETPEGFEWLRLLVLATVYIFGIKQGVGSEVISEFFDLLRLNRQVGVSPTALRRERSSGALRNYHLSRATTSTFQTVSSTSGNHRSLPMKLFSQDFQALS